MTPRMRGRQAVTTTDATSLAKSVRQLARDDFYVFAQRAFSELHDVPYMDNWHILAIARQLDRVEKGEIMRLIITMPPRTMKSFLGSVCFPAWILGKNPSAKIICASYAQALSNEFAFEMRRLMQTPWYRAVFPNVHIDAKKASVDEVKTTRGGYRLSTSVGGSLTGRGADFIVIDDPIKAGDALSQTIMASAIAWYSNTVSSRLNNQKTGKIVVVAQRLQPEDLPGQLAAMGSWEELTLPMIAWQDQEIELIPGTFANRPAGNLLHEARFGEEEIRRLRAEMTEQDFEAQYNQRPLPPGGALFKLQWLKRYDKCPAVHEIQGIFQSWDTAYEVAEGNDYSVCSTWALCGKRYVLLDIFRERLQFPDLERAVYRQREKWDANLVIVEKAGSGISLYQNIRNHTRRFWIVNISPSGSKQDRASQQSPKFERGEVYVPNDAPWLKTFEDELISFPHFKHDDQVDSVVQFLAAVDTGRLLNMADMARR
ncbi:phage terminase large subunit [Sphingorhabdus sp.]|uniref:phage terminase large subunit n=1 Tax=Sphingorhabdus sp. TaxID=1902408 RepID=UPI0039196F09